MRFRPVTFLCAVRKPITSVWRVCALSWAWRPRSPKHPTPRFVNISEPVFVLAALASHMRHKGLSSLERVLVELV